MARRLDRHKWGVVKVGSTGLNGLRSPRSGAIWPSLALN